MDKQLLSGKWNMHKEGEPRVIDAIVPGTMYSNLLENGYIEDPFYGENDKILTSLSDDSYIFYRDFDVDEALLSKERIMLKFYGLDTLATIYLNDKFVAKTNNMHRTYEFNVTNIVKKLDNRLLIKFDSPARYIEKEFKKNPVWGVNTTIPGYSYIRKGHHMFGWDWDPQLPDMGIWRNVELVGYNQARFEDVYIHQQHENGEVQLDIDIMLDAWSNMDTNIQIKLFDPEGICVYESSTPIENTMTSSIKVSNPDLWWPNGYGKQALYRLEIKLSNKEDILDSWNKKIGLRTLTIKRDADQWGETFNFVINNVSIFGMGANYIPEDALITRSTKEQTLELIKSCADANFNCLRVWGGGVYPSDYLYDLCDEYGLIIWQDFMFACGVYKLTEQFEQNIREELIDNIKRLRHHACLGLWCGNNEMEWAFVDWGLSDNENQKLEYLRLYEYLIPSVLNKYDPETFYWPASPSSGGGFNKPNDENKGDVHYWSVFHGNEHYKKFRDHYFRFISEYGMQSFPSMKTINSFCEEKDKNLYGPVIENHNKCIDPVNGNLKIMYNVAMEFPQPKDFEQTVYVSQVLQGEALKCGIEHWRRNRGRCMGSTYWQVNDNYPGASWSSIDYYGRWKGLHYYAKRFYAPLLLSGYEDGKKVHLHVTNDQLENFEGEVNWQIYHIDKGLLAEGNKIVEINALTAHHVITLDLSTYLSNDLEMRKIYVAYGLLNARGEEISSSTLVLTPYKHFELQKPEIDIQLVKKGSEIELIFTSDVYVKSLAIDHQDIDFLLSDNFFDIIPGKVKTVIIQQKHLYLDQVMLLDGLVMNSVNDLY